MIVRYSPQSSTRAEDADDDVQGDDDDVQGDVLFVRLSRLEERRALFLWWVSH